MGLLLAFAFLLRAYDLGTPSLWMDEAITAVAAQGVLDHGLPMLPSGEPYHRGLLNTYVVAAFFGALGVSELAGRLPSVFFGTATVGVVFLLGSALGGRRVGVVAAVIMAFSTWDITWSRQARMYAQLELFVWGSFLAAHWFMARMTWRRGAAVAALTVGAILSHEFAIVLPVLLVVYFLLSSPRVGRGLGADLGSRLTVLLAIVPALAVIAVTMLRLRIIDMGRVIQSEANYAGQYYEVFVEELGPVFYLAIAGTAVLLASRWRIGLFLALAAGLPFYVLSFHVYLFASRYLHFVMPALVILAAFAIDFAVRMLWRYARPIWPVTGALPALVTALVLIAVMAPSPQFTFAPRTRYDLGSHAPQPAFKEAAATMRPYMEKGDVVVSAWTPLTQFYLGRVDYWLVWDIVGIGSDAAISESGREVYSGATPLGRVGDLEAVYTEHPRGWLVVDDIVWERLDAAYRTFLNENLSRMHGESFRSVQVWSWGTASSP
jgi:uncharacterized membrane protein